MNHFRIVERFFFIDLIELFFFIDLDLNAVRMNRNQLDWIPSGIAFDCDERIPVQT